ncbi:MAG: SLATT domain-containing protein [Chloroflexi bacterium]|nr:MAG: SLATT domain-containing protein [Chloroflexota bacterium]
MNSPNQKLDSTALESAWRRFAEFDLNAAAAARYHKRLREVALGLAMVAVLFAVLTGSYNVIRFVPPYLHFTFSVALIVILIVNFIILALVIQSHRAAAAAELQAAAQEIKKEIYLYRTIMQWHDDPDHWLSERLGHIQRHVADSMGSEFSLNPYTGPLPPGYLPDDPTSDPGFTRLLPNDYLRYRLENQIATYTSELADPQKRRVFLQVGLLVTGGLSLLLAAIGGQLNAWVAVSVFAAAGLISWLEPRQLDSAISNLNQLIMGLNIVKDRWQSLGADQHTPEEYFKLVVATERIIWSHYNKHGSEMWRAVDELRGHSRDALDEVQHLSAVAALPAEPAPAQPDTGDIEIVAAKIVSIAENGTEEKPDSAPAVVETAPPALPTSAAAPAQGLPHAFVVMPFGRKQGSDGRWLDFDAIYTGLIRPALEAAGFEAFRADEESVSGDILTDMFQELLLADLVIADLSIDNANVFYELGVRHAIRRRGVVHIQSGRSYMPFDIFNVRTIPYHVDKHGRPDAAHLEKDRQLITKITRETWASDTDRVHSPIFNLLQGLPEPDRKALRTPLATGFWREYNEWKERVAIARRQKRIGDVLLLTDEISNPLIKEEAIAEAGKALQGMGRHELALQQYRRGLEINPGNTAFRRQEAFHLNRLGRIDEAIVKLERLLRDMPNDIEAISTLGRIYKQMWNETWENVADLQGRIDEAYKSSHWLVKSINTYLAGYRLDQNNYYPGINALTGSVLMDYLCSRQSRTETTPDPELDEIRQNLPKLKGALQFALESAIARNGSDYWALVSLAELEVSHADDAEQVTRAYRKALTAARKNAANLTSSLAQLELLKSLDFRPEFVQAGIDVLQGELNRVKSEADSEDSGSSVSPAQVFLFAGHPIDPPSQRERRFPAAMEKEVRQKIEAALAQHNPGKNDLAITAGAAAGGDIIFLELCLERGMRAEIHLPFDEARYIQEAISYAGDQWVERFYTLRNSPNVVIRQQVDHLGPVKPGDNIIGRNVRWALYAALVYGIDHTRFIILWDGKTSHTPGGPDSVLEQVRQLGGRIEHLNTTKFDYWKAEGKVSRALDILTQGL